MHNGHCPTVHDCFRFFGGVTWFLFFLPLTTIFSHFLHFFSFFLMVDFLLILRFTQSRLLIRMSLSLSHLLFFLSSLSLSLEKKRRSNSCFFFWPSFLIPIFPVNRALSLLNSHTSQAGHYHGNPNEKKYCDPASLVVFSSICYIGPMHKFSQRHKSDLSKSIIVA